MLVSVVGVDFQLMSVVCIVAVDGVVFILICTGGVVPVVASAGCIVGVALSQKNCEKKILSTLHKFSVGQVNIVLASKYRS